MLEKMTSWILSSSMGMFLDREELSVLELVGKTAKKTNEIVEETNKKVDVDGDFNGTWIGMKPTQTNEFIQAQVDSNTNKIEEVTNELQTISIDGGFYDESGSNAFADGGIF